MRILQFLGLALWLLGLVQCAPIEKRVSDVAAVAGTTPMRLSDPNAEKDFVWELDMPAPGPVTFTTLYNEASKAYNWLVQQPVKTDTANGGRIIAAFYDHRKRKIYLSTILRGTYYAEVSLRQTPDVAPIWRRAHTKRSLDAEDGAYYLREKVDGAATSNYGDEQGKPAGSKIVAWGTKGFGNTQARSLTLCPDCQKMSYSLGVEFEGADPNRYGGNNNPRPPPKGPLGRPLTPPGRPLSAPPRLPSPPRPNTQAGSSTGPNTLTRPRPSSPGSRIPRPVPGQAGSSTGFGTAAQQPPGSPGSRGSTPSSSSSIWSQLPNPIEGMSQSEVDRLFRENSLPTTPPGQRQPLKRPASQPPSPQRRPQGPGSPSRIPAPIPLRPSSGSSSSMGSRVSTPPRIPPSRSPSLGGTSRGGRVSPQAAPPRSPSPPGKGKGRATGPR